MSKRRFSSKVIFYFLALMFLVVSVGCAKSDDLPQPSATTYTVTFDSRNATTAANPAIKTVTSPATTVGALPTEPAKTGYTFSGWWTEVNGGGTPFTAGTAVTADITVYAKWVSTDLFPFTDNFDSYSRGAFPISGGWMLRYDGAGEAYQYVDNAQSVSGQQSMRLVGSPCWSSAMYHPLDFSSKVNITYEANVFVDEIVSCGCTPSLAVMRLINPSLGTWGTGFGSVAFNCDGNIYAMQATEPTSNVLLMPYNAQQWYNIKLNINLVARTFDVYVNSVLKGSGLQILDSGNPTGIEVLADHGSNPAVWFDDLRVQ